MSTPFNLLGLQTSSVIDKFVSEGKLASVAPANIERQREILQRPLSARTKRYKRIMERKEKTDLHNTAADAAAKTLKDVVEVTVA